MYSWFTQKLNEMAGLAHYCDYPVLEAHFVLTQRAVNEVYGEQDAEDTSLKDLLPLMISQAESDGEYEAAHHMRQALQALGQQTTDAENVVAVDFAAPKAKRSRSIS